VKLQMETPNLFALPFNNDYLKQPMNLCLRHMNVHVLGAKLIRIVIQIVTARVRHKRAEG
jgi:hypothetical protein